jgi:hypothetical protein
MSRKVFTAGEVLAAADVNSFLMDQSVMSFAGTAARGSAIPSPVEGMTTFLEDSNALGIYDGSVWKNPLKTTGGILQVVNATYSIQTVTTSTSFVSTGLTATITPLSTSSRIFVVTQTTSLIPDRSAYAVFTVFRGTVAGTNLGNGTVGAAILYPSGSPGASVKQASISLVDSPNTTSAQTYTLAFKYLTANGNNLVIQVDGTQASMTLMEIAG